MRIKRTSDVIELISERAFYFLGGGVLAAALAFLFLRYKGDGMFVGLGWVLALASSWMHLLRNLRRNADPGCKVIPHRLPNLHRTK